MPVKVCRGGRPTVRKHRQKHFTVKKKQIIGEKLEEKNVIECLQKSKGGMGFQICPDIVGFFTSSLYDPQSRCLFKTWNKKARTIDFILFDLVSDNQNVDRPLAPAIKSLIKRL